VRVALAQICRLTISDRIITIGAMPRGRTRIEYECQCVSDCIRINKRGTRFIDENMLLRFADENETSVFFSFHVNVDRSYRVITSRLCGFLPVCSRRDMDFIEKLLS
jgi:hypothetical protein